MILKIYGGDTDAYVKNFFVLLDCRKLNSQKITGLEIPIMDTLRIRCGMIKMRGFVNFL